MAPTPRTGEHRALVHERHVPKPTVVARGTAGHDGAVVEPVTVWRVQLRRGDVRDREGTLRLDDDALVFVDGPSQSETRVPFAEIRSARRVKGSPILDRRARRRRGTGRDRLLLLAAAAARGSAPRQRRHDADWATGPPVRRDAPLRKRRHQRENVKYLATKAGGGQPTIQAWADETGARVRG